MVHALHQPFRNLSNSQFMTDAGDDQTQAGVSREKPTTSKMSSTTPSLKTSRVFWSSGSLSVHSPSGDLPESCTQLAAFVRLLATPWIEATAAPPTPSRR